MIITQTIYCRSPFVIEVYGTSTQIETKVEVFVWNKGQTEPSIPTYTLTAKAPSVTDSRNYYNISPYIVEGINIAHWGNMDDPETHFQTYFNWCYVRVKKYYSTVSGVFIPTPTLSDKYYNSVYGYTNYLYGTNAAPTMQQSYSYTTYIGATASTDYITPLWNVRTPIETEPSMIGYGYLPLLITLNSTSSWHLKFENVTTGQVLVDYNLTGGSYLPNGSYIAPGLSQSTLLSLPYPIDYLIANDENKYNIKLSLIHI